MLPNEYESFARELSLTQTRIMDFFSGQNLAHHENEPVVGWNRTLANIQSTLKEIFPAVVDQGISSISRILSAIRGQLGPARPQNRQQIEEALAKTGKMMASIESIWETIATEEDQQGVGRANNEIHRLRQLLSDQSAELAQAKRNFDEFLIESKNKITQYSGDLADTEKAFSETAQKYYAQEPRLNEVLGNASKVGLSASFGARAQKLAKAKLGWTVLLGASLVAMYWTGNSLISAVQQDVKWQLLVLRSLLSLPLVWAAWFAARQYGYASKLQEDYEFKVASATSYEAYRKEATQINEQMEIKLIESAIQTFSENPLRIYNIPSDPGTPLQEILENIAKLDKVVEATSKWRKPAATE